MHRREGDFSNAKYWFRRAGDHPVYAPLAERARVLAARLAAADLPAGVGDGGWDPYAMVDLCAAARQGGSPVELALDLQQAEWELLFDHCYRVALTC